ncbi:hypothetical protein [Bradyrhizobium sp. CCBAU 51745]|uniref:hypothetical protein n=1 Tax=Bradyrhizobium sp. CCBAU 51745 TaxID=1325099 RepID=UPI002FE1D305
MLGFAQGGLQPIAFGLSAGVFRLQFSLQSVDLMLQKFDTFGVLPLGLVQCRLSLVDRLLSPLPFFLPGRLFLDMLAMAAFLLGFVGERRLPFLPLVGGNGEPV